MPAPIKTQVSIETKYDGYLKRQEKDIQKSNRNSEKTIPDDFDYDKVKGLSAEVSEKLQKVRPRTLEQAKRIPGMTPAVLSLLLVYLKR